MEEITVAVSDIEEDPHIRLANSMRDEWVSIPVLSSDCCIYRVPHKLRCVNEEVYTPQLVSIGPLHHGKENLEPMEQHKIRYLQDFMSRTNVRLEDYVQKIKEKEKSLRDCYAEPIGFCSDQFVKIILVDAVFIIQLLLKRASKTLADESDRIFNKPGFIRYIVPDMLLLENQLPFFILEDLFHIFETSKNAEAETETETETSDNTKLRTIITYSYELFVEMGFDLKYEEGDLKEKFSPTSNQVKHFVDFMRTLHVPLGESKTGGKLETTPSITELHRAGVKFKVGSSNNILDIQFKDGILEIPIIKVGDYTELLLRNLMAFEQCHCEDNYICAYFIIMDDLVSTSNDVELLAKDGIIVNWLGDNNKVSTMINNLNNGVKWDPEGFYFGTFCGQLNKYCKKPTHKWKANLRQNYFNTPWAAISVFAAILLLTLTIIQTVCSIISIT